jgi:hypothetical protein
MRNILLALALAACAGSDTIPAPAADAGDAGLGQSEQAIYRGTGYGIDTSTGLQCEIQSTGCQGPKSKTVTYKFAAGTCSSWMQARVVEATIALEANADQWGFIWQADAANGWLTFKCGPAPSAPTALGGFERDGVTQTTLSDGKLWSMPKKGTIWLNPAQFGGSAWNAATESQRRIFVHNLIKHEAGHVMGLGHTPDGSGHGPLMNVAVPMETPLAIQWKATLWYSSVQAGWLQCYNPSIPSTQPLCD